MLVKFNPSGTHVHKGFLKVRVDLYPEPTDKTYPIHHIQVPVIPPEGYQGAVDNMGSPVDQSDYDNWINGLPKIWQLNPALGAFIRVPETVVKGELEDFTRQLFNKDTAATLDDILVKPNSIHLVSPFMRNKLTLSDQKVQTKDIADLIGSVNGRFADLVLPLEGGGSSLPVEPQTIDIGAPAINREAGWQGQKTMLSIENPANASGTIDTAEIWVNSVMWNFVVGTFYFVTGTDYKCRGSEAIGDVSAGSKQTFSGLSFSVETADYVGEFGNSGTSPNNGIERTYSGFAGLWRHNADVTNPGDQATYTFIDGDAISLFGTGTEAGGPTLQAVGGGSIAIASTLNLKTMISVGAGAISISGSLGTIRRFLQSVGSGSVAITGILGRLIKVGVGSGSISISGALVTVLTFFQTVGSGSIAIAGTLGLKTSIAVGAGSIGIAGVLGRLTKISVGSPWSWESPTGHNDPDTAWSNEANAYDENTSTHANSIVGTEDWSSYLELTIAAVRVDSVRFYATFVTPGPDQISIDVYYGAAWVNIYEGTFSDETWITKEILAGIQSVTKARVKFYNSHTTLGAQARLYEFDFWGGGGVTLAGALGLKTLISVGAGSVALTGALGRKIALSVGSGSIAISSVLGRLIKLGVGDGAVAITGILTFHLNRFLRIVSSLATSLGIISSKGTDLTIVFSLSTDLSIVSTLEVR